MNRKKTQPIKEEIEIPERCSYLDKYNQNLSQMEFIDKHVCSNFKNRFKEGDKVFCIFHYPNESKSNEFQTAFNEKLTKGHFIFNGTWFPDSVDLSWVEFNTPANFSHCFFRKDVSFSNASFLLGADFRCAMFGEKADFSYASFLNTEEISDLEISFYSTEFLCEVNFHSTKFRKRIDFADSAFVISVDFSNAEFSEDVSFKKAYIRSSYFSETTFEKNADFYEVKFFNAGFNKTFFKKVADFRESIVKSSISFEGSSFEGFVKFSGRDRNHNSWALNALNFTSTDIEKPEKVSFRSLTLKPDSFINTDTRKFEFTDIKWKRKNFAGDWSRFKDIFFWKEEAKRRKSQYELLAIAYSRLAVNAEENNRYKEASNFRFTANEIQRIGNHWYGRLPSLGWLYKWSSRFGESWLWTLFILVTVIFAVFPYIYTQTDFRTCSKDRPIATSLTVCESKDEEIRKNCTCSTDQITFTDAIIQSLTTATLQNVEYRKPLTVWGELWIILEKIFAPLQAALLALAIRRKFMR